MPLNPQTANFPPISLMEQSWALELRSFAAAIAPGAGVRSGIELTLPMTSGQPIAGLTPVTTDGYLLAGDQVLGLRMSQLISAAPVSVANRRIFFGLSGLYYAIAANTPAQPTDFLLGEITTDATHIISIAQPRNFGASRFGVSGVLNLTKAVKGADTNLFTWVKPSGLGKNTRIAHAMARVIAPVTAGNAASDNFVLKAESTTLATLTGTELGTLNTLNAGANAAWVLTNNSIAIKYNQTDAGGDFTGGAVEFSVLMECF